MKRETKENGITLVALVITIIILLILAGITISQLSGNGLFENAKLSEEKTKKAQEEENSILQGYENIISQSLSKKQYVSIVYNANGGSGTMTTQQIEVGETTNISQNLFTNELAFLKWNTKSDATGTDYSEQSEITLNENITLYAIWGDAQLKDWEFSIDANTKKITLTKYIGSNTEVVIASKYNYNDIEYSTVMGNSYAGSVTVGDRPKASRNYYGPFVNNITIQKITFEDGVIFGTTGIQYAFIGCWYLEEINNIPKVDYQYIDYTWYGCKKIKEVKIPKGITSISRSTFLYCSLLEKVYISSNVTKIDATISTNTNTLMGPFEDTPNVTIYCEVDSAPSGYAEYWNYYTTTVELPVVYSVTEEAFDNL